MRRTSRPEQDVQRAIFQHLKIRSAPCTFAFHVPNGGYRKPIEAAILKGLGVVSGTPDVIVIRGGRTYALELKSESGKASPKQVETMAAMELAGATVALAVGAGCRDCPARGLGNLERQDPMTAPPLDIASLIAALEAGELVLRAPSPFARRDMLVRQAYVDHFAGELQTMADRWRLYERVSWPRERGLDVCPSRRLGQPEAYFWRIMRLVPRALSADRIERICR
jgi:hypothetical protein